MAVAIGGICRSLLAENRPTKVSLPWGHCYSCFPEGHSSDTLRVSLFQSYKAELAGTMFPAYSITWAVFLAGRHPELLACPSSDPGLITTQLLSSSSTGFPACSPSPAFLGGQLIPLCHSSPPQGLAFSVCALATRHNPNHSNWSKIDSSGSELVLLPCSVSFCCFVFPHCTKMENPLSKRPVLLSFQTFSWHNTLPVLPLRSFWLHRAPKKIERLPIWLHHNRSKGIYRPTSYLFPHLSAPSLFPDCVSLSLEF